MEASVSWKHDMAFEVALDGHTFLIDADEGVGGQNLGPRPKGLTLASLAGCTAMDVIAILQKMRLPPTSLKVNADGVVATDHPKRFVSIVVRYEVTGPVPADRLLRAVELSTEKYCGVNATLRTAVPITHEVWLNGEKVA